MKLDRLEFSIVVVVSMFLGYLIAEQFCDEDEYGERVEISDYAFNTRLGLVDARMDLINLAIHGNPNLREWRKNDHVLWTWAKIYDESMVDSGEYNNVAIEKRFADVVDRINEGKEYFYQLEELNDSLAAEVAGQSVDR
jgi:hypothetical protein